MNHVNEFVHAIHEDRSDPERKKVFSDYLRDEGYDFLANFLKDRTEEEETGKFKKGWFSHYEPEIFRNSTHLANNDLYIQDSSGKYPLYYRLGLRYHPKIGRFFTLQMMGNKYAPNGIHETGTPIVTGASKDFGQLHHFLRDMQKAGVDTDSEVNHRIKDEIDKHPEHFRRGTPTRFSNTPEDHAAFHRAMEEDPENAPKVYADYLEENGKPEIAKVMRLWKPTYRDFFSVNPNKREGQKPGEFSILSQPGMLAWLTLRPLHNHESEFSWPFDPERENHINLEDIKKEADYDELSGKRIKKERMSRSQPARFAQNTNYAITRRELGSKNAQNALALTEDVLKKARLSPYEIQKVIHQIGNTAFPSIGFNIHQDHPAENVAYASAFNALIAQQPGFVLFGGDEDGSDSLYHFTVGSNISNLPQLLTQAGFSSFWIKPTQQGSQVTVFDKGRRLRQLIERLAAEMSLQVIEHLGNSVVVGHQEPAKARQIYRQIIREFESQGGR